MCEASSKDTEDVVVHHEVKATTPNQSLHTPRAPNPDFTMETDHYPESVPRPRAPHT